MKVLFLAIAVLYVTQVQAIGYGKIQAYSKDPNLDITHVADRPRQADEMSGAEVLDFAIKTLQRLQDLFEKHNWANLYEIPDLTLPLPKQVEDEADFIPNSRPNNLAKLMWSLPWHLNPNKPLASQLKSQEPTIGEQGYDGFPSLILPRPQSQQALSSAHRWYLGNGGVLPGAEPIEPQHYSRSFYGPQRWG